MFVVACLEQLPLPSYSSTLVDSNTHSGFFIQLIMFPSLLVPFLAPLHFHLATIMIC